MDLHVLLACFNGPGIKLRHTQIEITDHTDDDEFFHRVRQSYNTLRGPIRRWLSPHRFHCCSFVKYTRIWANELAKGPQDLPLDAAYHYIPRPISPHEWYCRFYYLRSTHGLREALDRIPKRNRRFETALHVNGLEDMWGLHIEYHIACHVVIMWQVAISLGGWVFWIWWYNEHQGDWQNASSVVMAVLAATTVLWSPLNKHFQRTF